MRAPRRLAAIAALALPFACAASDPPQRPAPAEAPSAIASGLAPPGPAPRPRPACPETLAGSGAWPRPEDFTKVVPSKPGALGHLEQRWSGRPARLRFLGAHLFDLLGKLRHEGGGGDAERRRVACAALDAVARAGAPVVRLWGFLKATGSPDEVGAAADMLALLLDENARRERPLRFVVTLVNHQAGYGAPDPSRSLDDQDPKSPWHARQLYLGGGWKARGGGSLAERIEAFAARPEIAESKEIIGWELVNELDTFRSVASGALAGVEAEALRREFLIPALGVLSARFPQPVLVGDLRGHAASYIEFARSLLAALPAEARGRLVWTGHVYAPKVASAKDPALGRATWKLDKDLAIAAEHGLPFLLGEIGQHVPGGAARFCGGGAAHDLPQLFGAVLEGRPAIEAALFWGEGLCRLEIPGSEGAWVSIGAGGDSADIGPEEVAAREALRGERGKARFLAD
ncbi:hypothetical protein [Polyangium aurulentum]|uniref:hypothetical protein n=1 Tax=Polyangium aurulentum TaxID=2567896 RepID=UPI0010AE9A23|nr:hypothetical protein [Polyangium aurulentum]UQA55665.1 hypothetical protein E8A73_030555 [Polyangium aurulentum]